MNAPVRLPLRPLARFADSAPGGALSPDLRARLRVDARDADPQAGALLAVLYTLWSPLWLDLCPETADAARLARAHGLIPLAEDTRARIWPEAQGSILPAVAAIRASGGLHALSACYGRAIDRGRSTYYPPVWRLTCAAAALAHARGADLGPVTEAARGVWGQLAP